MSGSRQIPTSAAASESRQGRSDVGPSARGSAGRTSRLTLLGGPPLERLEQGGDVQRRVLVLQPPFGLPPAPERAESPLAMLGAEVGQRVLPPGAEPASGEIEPRVVLLERVGQLGDARS